MKEKLFKSENNNKMKDNKIKKLDCTNQLINELGNNVQSITYSTESKEWEIKYKNTLISDLVSEDEFICFLRNA